MTPNEVQILANLTNTVKALNAKIDLLLDGGRMRQPFWNAEQTMKFLGVSRNTLYKIASQIGGSRLGRQWRFNPVLVQNFKSGVK